MASLLAGIHGGVRLKPRVPEPAEDPVARREQIALQAATHKAHEREVELGVEELAQIFSHVELQPKGAKGLAVLARVCRIWRTAASHLRRDLGWQMRFLAVSSGSGVPDVLLMPHSSEGLRRFVAEEPQHALEMLSISQLRNAGAPVGLIAQRLDFDDGLVIPLTLEVVVATGEPKRISGGARARARAAHAHRALPSAAARKKLLDELRGELSSEPGQGGLGGGRATRRLDALLPLACWLELCPVAPMAEGEDDEVAASQRAVGVLVRGHRIGYVPQSFLDTVELGEGRLISIGSAVTRDCTLIVFEEQDCLDTWKVRVMPAMTPLPSVAVPI